MTQPAWSPVICCCQNTVTIHKVTYWRTLKVDHSALRTLLVVWNCRAPFTVKFIVLLQAEQGGLSIVAQILNLIRFYDCVIVVFFNYIKPQCVLTIILNMWKWDLWYGLLPVWGLMIICWLPGVWSCSCGAGNRTPCGRVLLGCCGLLSQCSTLIGYVCFCNIYLFIIQSEVK